MPLEDPQPVVLLHRMRQRLEEEAKYGIVIIIIISVRYAPVLMALRDLQESLAKKESRVLMAHPVEMVASLLLIGIIVIQIGYSRPTRAGCNTRTSSKSRRLLLHLRAIATWAGWKSFFGKTLISFCVILARS